MYIKSIVLDGFKSFKCRTEINGFDSHLTAITGLNGSGKSNILDAICFLLGTTLERMRASSPRELIYNNGASDVVTATVLATFDHTDENFKVHAYKDKSQITLCRQLKADGTSTFFINGTKVSKMLVLDMLGSVHLDGKNPHFIIMQGHITKVSKFSPVQLLSMIEEAVGTKRYLTQRKTAMNQISQAERRIKAIDEYHEQDIIPFVEKGEDEYQKYCKVKEIKEKLGMITRLRIAHSYVSLQTELSELKEQLEKISLVISRKEVCTADAKVEVQRLSNVMKGIFDTQDRASLDRLKKMEEEVQSCEHEKALLSAKLSSHMSSLQTEKQRLTLVEQYIKEEEAALAVKQAEMEEISKVFRSLQNSKAQDAQALADAQQKFQAVSAGLLSSEDGGTATLQEQLITAQNQLTKALTTKKTKKMELIHLQNDVLSKETALSGFSSHRELEDKLDILNEDLAKLSTDLQKLSSEEGTLEKLKHAATLVQADIQSNLQTIDFLRSRNISLTFEYKDPEPNFDRSRVLGLICRMFKMKDDNVARALEVAGGSKLFNVVVDNEETGKAILKKGQLRNRTTLIPLNKIISHRINKTVVKLARDLAGKGNSIPAIRLIEFDSKVSPALEWVFGETLICIDGNAAKVCSSDPINKRCVTLDGDVFNPNGIMSGGAVDPRTSVLSTLQELIATEDLLSANEAKLKTLKKEIEKSLESGKNCVSIRKMHSLKSREAQLLQSRLNQLDHKQLEKDIINSKTQIHLVSNELKALHSEIDELKSKVSRLTAKVGNSKVVYNEELAIAKKEMESCKQKSNESYQNWTARKQEHLNLKMEIDELQNALKSSQEQVALHLDHIKIMETESAELQKDIDTITNKATQCSGMLQLEREKNIWNKGSFSKSEERRSLVQKSVNEWELDLKKLKYEKRKLLTQFEKRGKLQKNLLSENKWIKKDSDYFGVSGGKYDFKNYRSRDIDNFIEELQESVSRMNVNFNYEQIKQFQDVKKKLAQAQQMRKIVEEQKKSILELIDVLDNLRIKTIEAAFLKVNFFFGGIFSLLLPGAQAKLVHLRGKKVTQGLQIKVAFGKTWRDDLSELSGGQKSLLALSLVLAIQSFNPAPIYILDEIDAALDEVHTRNIGVALRNFFSNSQFIIVSLKEPMFMNARVLFKTRLSSGVSLVSQSSAMDKHRRSIVQRGH